MTTIDAALLFTGLSLVIISVGFMISNDLKEIIKLLKEKL